MSDKSSIYLDYNASTPVDPEVLAEMLPFFSEHFANAASQTHFPGRFVMQAISLAREKVAQLIQCEPGEIIFTSGSTESINLAVCGVARAYKSKGNHLITWQTEHKAVLESHQKLIQEGFRVSILPVNRDGLPDIDQFKKTITDETILVSSMMANNETGVIFPVNEIAAITHSNKSILFCDATQAPGKMRIDINEINADLLCISAHKMYGPKGTGALYLRRKNPRVKPEPIIVGGGHENGLRAGTLNVPGIVGMGKAAELCMNNYWDDISNLSYLRTILEQELIDNGRGYINGSIRNRIPNTTNICFPGIRASSLMTLVPDFAMATGSACSSALPEPSHVLEAMGLSKDDCFASLRLSLGRMTTKEEILNVISILTHAVDTIIKKNNP